MWRNPLRRIRYCISYRQSLYAFSSPSLLVFIRLMQHYFLPRFRLFFSCRMKFWVIRSYLLCYMFVSFPSSNFLTFVLFSRNMLWTLWHWQGTRNWRTFSLPKRTTILEPAKFWERNDTSAQDHYLLCNTYLPNIHNS
jgi:hypothetical protein